MGWVEHFEVVTLSEKESVVGRYGIKKVDQFLLVRLQDLDILLYGFDTCLAQSFGQPGLEQLTFAVMQVDAALVVYESA